MAVALVRTWIGPEFATLAPESWPLGFGTGGKNRSSRSWVTSLFQLGLDLGDSNDPRYPVAVQWQRVPTARAWWHSRALASFLGGFFDQVNNLVISLWRSRLERDELLFPYRVVQSWGRMQSQVSTGNRHLGNTSLSRYLSRYLCRVPGWKGRRDQINLLLQSP